jgi:hypothetical protein
MKKIFKQELLEFFLCLVHKNHWTIDVECEQNLRELINKSIDDVDRTSHDCAKEEMRQFAKTNLSFLITSMHIDAQRRNLNTIDFASLQNALAGYNSLWPFKTAATRFTAIPIHTNLNDVGASDEKLNQHRTLYPLSVAVA